MRSILTIFLGSFLAVQGCTPEAPLVTREDGSALPYTIVVASGIRDGYTLTARLAFFAPDLINSLQMQLRVEIGVVPKLQSGTWTLGPEKGSISADWLNFFGGQGGAPVIAGRFRLIPAAPGMGRTFIVNLPKTEIRPQGTGFQGGQRPRSERSRGR